MRKHTPQNKYSMCHKTSELFQSTEYSVHTVVKPKQEKGQEHKVVGLETTPLCSSLWPESIEHKQNWTCSHSQLYKPYIQPPHNPVFISCFIQVQTKELWERKHSLIPKAQEAKQTHNCCRYSDLNSRSQTLQKLSKQKLCLSVQHYTNVHSSLHLTDKTIFRSQEWALCSTGMKAVLLILVKSKYTPKYTSLVIHLTSAAQKSQ